MRVKDEKTKSATQFGNNLVCQIPENKKIKIQKEKFNMTHTDLTNTTNTPKTNTHNNQLQNENVESYSNFMNSVEYFSVFGFLLAGLANYMIHEKRISD